MLTVDGVLMAPNEALRYLKLRLESYQEVYGLKAAAIAVYPMYKGLARLVGMEVVGQPQTLTEQVQLLREHWDEYDFFFVHFKYTDSTGEDGDFEGKRQRIEELDAVIPEIDALKPSDRTERPIDTLDHCRETPHRSWSATGGSGAGRQVGRPPAKKL